MHSHINVIHKHKKKNNGHVWIKKICMLLFVLQNMVGPGEVDDELEPEVREECNGKYGAVVQVVIFEIPKAVPEEAVRIFVEFQRVESAIKGEFVSCL